MAHAGDGLAILKKPKLLTNVVLSKRSQYVSWEVALLTTARGQILLSLLDGTAKLPKDDAPATELDEFQYRSDHLVARLFKSLSTDEQIIFQDKLSLPHELWRAIQARYEKHDPIDRHRLRSELNNMEYRGPMESFCMNMKQLA